jgi:hypothetical protein
LQEVFEARLNPPEIVPEEFDRDERDRHRWLSDMLPASTPDTSPRQTFSRPFVIADIEQVKLHIRKHNIKSASGMDRVSYSKILRIPNDILVQLFQASVCGPLSPPNGADPHWWSRHVSRRTMPRGCG